MVNSNWSVTFVVGQISVVLVRSRIAVFPKPLFDHLPFTIHHLPGLDYGTSITKKDARIGYLH